MSETPSTAESKNLSQVQEHFHFTDLPEDIRHPIYCLILVNPIIGTPASISLANDYGEHAVYDLEVQVMQASKKIYEESKDVLYGLNTFYNIYQSSPISSSSRM